MKKSVLFKGLMFVALGVALNNHGAQAQFGGNRGGGGFGGGGNNNNGGRGAQGGRGGVLPLPNGLSNLVSIDAYNELLVQVDRNGKRDLAALTVKHIYSGGIAAVFGGTSIPTEQFVTPGAFGGGNQNGGGGGRGNGFGGNTGVSGGFGGGGNSGFGGGGLGGGFGGGGFGGGGFGGGGFGGGGFGGGGLGGGGGTGFGGGFGNFQIRPKGGN